MKMRCMFLLALGVFLLAHPLQGASVIPSVLPGNPNCNTLCPGCYSELKVDPPQEGTFSDSVLTVTISNATYKPDDDDDDGDWDDVIDELDELIAKVDAATMPDTLKESLIGKLEYAKTLVENAEILYEAGNVAGAKKTLGVAKSQVESFASMVETTSQISPEDKAIFLDDAAEIIAKIDELITFVSGGDDDENEMMSFDWSANIGVNVVIVKAGNQANVYEYDPAVTSDTYLVPPGKQAISHITFCYVPPQITVQVSGLKNLTVTQPLIRDWSSSGDFRILIGDPSDNTCLTVEVTANVAYNVCICYTYSVSPGAAPLDGTVDVLRYQWNDTWYPILYSTNSDYCSSMTTLYGFSGSPPNKTNKYPVDLNLTKLGDRNADDSITFTVRITVTQ